MASAPGAVPLGEDGQPLSKNALKRLQKAEFMAKQKAEKAATKPATEAPKKKEGDAGEEEEELDAGKYFDFRCKAMKELQVGEQIESKEA